MSMLSPVLNVGAGSWHIGVIEEHTARPLSRTEIEALCAEVNELRKQRELHTMQLAAICTATIQNTEATIKDRIDRDNPYWTVPYGDVCRSVDREMKLREQRDRMRRSLRWLTLGPEAGHKPEVKGDLAIYEQMRRVMHLMPVPDDEKAGSIEAITALIDTASEFLPEAFQNQGEPGPGI